VAMIPKPVKKAILALLLLTFCAENSSRKLRKGVVVVLAKPEREYHTYYTTEFSRPKK
jgi:hypothetical protein